MAPNPDRPPLLTLRAAVVLLLAALAGIGSGILIGLTGTHPAQAVLSGIVAAGGTAAFFHNAID
jgi:hypothetical protein